MFDIGFSEILLIFGLALIVLGPEKLPRVASQVGRWIGRARGMARQFREQLEEEVNLEEARKSRPPSPAGTFPEGTTPAAIEPPSVPSASTDHGVIASAGGVSPDLPAEATAPASAAAESSAQPQQPSYPDHYSHAHPTDADGRPLPPPTSEAPAAESGQHDWVGVPSGDTVPSGDACVTPTDKPAQGTTDAGYAPPHERGI